MDKVSGYKEYFNLKILSLKGQLFDGEVSHFSAKSQIGNFDILKNHINFVSILVPGQITYLEKELKEEKIITIDNGILVFTNNQAKVFVNFT